MRRLTFALSFVLAIVGLIASTGCNGFFVSENAIDHISLNASAVVLSTAGTTGAETKQLTASAVKVNGSSTDVTSTSTWTTSDANVATVDASGIVKAVGAGTATVTATSGGKKGTITVLVTTSTVSQLNVTPGSTNLHMSTGPTTVQLVASVALANGSTLTVTQYATWTSDNTSVATVSTTGLVTGVTATGTITGTTVNITAAGILSSSSTLSGKATVTVDAL